LAIADLTFNYAITMHIQYYHALIVP
jgi:hypothetical protein